MNIRNEGCNISKLISWPYIYNSHSPNLFFRICSTRTFLFSIFEFIERELCYFFFSLCFTATYPTLHQLISFTLTQLQDLFSLFYLAYSSSCKYNYTIFFLRCFIRIQKMTKKKCKRTGPFCYCVLYILFYREEAAQGQKINEKNIYIKYRI